MITLFDSLRTRISRKRLIWLFVWTVTSRADPLYLRKFLYRMLQNNPIQNLEIENNPRIAQQNRVDPIGENRIYSAITYIDTFGTKV